VAPEDLVDALSGVEARWWLAGGWAIDLFLGRRTREHEDIDVQILRPDHVGVRAALSDWDAHAADPPGTLRPWRVDEELPPEVHDIWVRRGADDPWRFQLMIADVAGDDWVYRRDHRIRRPVSELSGPASTPERQVLAPEVQLLYKSKGPRPKDEADFAAARDALGTDRRDWLAAALAVAAPTHPWLDQLR
jgi:hypothetical protein